MWLVGRYGGRNHVCNISWLSVKGWGCGEKGKFAFSHWLHASPLQHWSHYRVTVWFEPNLAQNINTTLSARRNGQNHINWKSMKAAAAILNFGKISITPDLMQISAANYMGRCIMAIRSWPKAEGHVTKIDIFKIQDGGWFPSSKSFNRHTSAIDRPISANFCNMKQNSMPKKVMWHKL